MKKLLIIGATSAIAHHTAINFAQANWELHLAARNSDKLDIIKKDILARHSVNIFTYEQDALDFDKHKSLFEQVKEEAQELDAVLIAHGTLPVQEEIQNEPDEIRKEFDINALSVMSYATITAEYFEKKKSGMLAVISSVAGDRGRMSNYIYGAAKSAVTAFTSGLRGRLEKSGVNVLTIKPGFVDTPMTDNVDKNFLFANPKDVGKEIYKAMTEEKDVLYVPGFWKIIMMLVKSVPESIFKKLKF
jgi:decaprenylphospho-beta-D-erythro-pentofuranosid-2-ulose 2-reductase